MTPKTAFQPATLGTPSKARIVSLAASDRCSTACRANDTASSSSLKPAKVQLLLAPKFLRRFEAVEQPSFAARCEVSPLWSESDDLRDLRQAAVHPTEDLFESHIVPPSPSFLWAEICEAKSKMDAAVKVEDYDAAAHWRDVLATLEGRITVQEPQNRRLNLAPSTNPVMEAIRRLKTGKMIERSQALETLEEIGDNRAVPALVEALKDPVTELRAKAERALWGVWHRYGMEDVDVRLQQGIWAMQRGQLEESIEIFGDVIRLAPDFAEGYNKRATARYLMRRFAESVADCEKVVELQPMHFGAWSGMGLCCVGMREFERAAECFRKAVELNPNMVQVKQYLAAVIDILANKNDF
mmetsp:Transcript_23709/g.40829  ORF Transcript_23709/g.40829 Transcript_23709/m.40829 type:complete len:355 (+) Transcript_23709:77-1141(+)|eukprot:CAMPEP_0196664488 /NCGR_PEP_ID=MMETSP1086-20130531/57361_1 /TAXON_ID=77921 /ORGANISM="Cyanoptyche  gloeocystis , Strain SAG4.97" /LENGTH=354 /DNA_ID=CAMNT_0042000823 /DNA_START=64 /DNA_END=1128 /DNA_ORIENTATION=+